MTPTSATPRRGHQDFLLIATVAETVSAFSTIERRLICYLRALWGQPVAFREADEPRVSIVQGDIRMPCQLRVGAGGDGVTLYRAAAAHAAAHLAYSTQRFPLGKLRPIQVALVSLIEDARIERLAWRDMPGLRRLWLPFHTARPGVIPNAVSLMARLARALIDPWVPNPRRYQPKAPPQIIVRAMLFAAATAL
jgi:nitric oxide reductase NorD protein